MQGNLFDLALLSVLILFFGLLQSHRSQRDYRMWLCAWVMVMCSYLTYMAPPPTGAWRVVQECIRVDFLICGGLTFLLSFVERTTSVQRLVYRLVLLSVSPCLLLDMLTAGLDHPWLYSVIILAGEFAGNRVAVQLLGAGTVRRQMQALCVGGALALWAAVWTGRPDMVLTVVLSQIFASCALLLFASQRRGRFGTWVTIVGFLAWALAYVAYEASWIWPGIGGTLDRVWNLPKYLVGFGMILTVVENDTARISVLSEEYRLLYESNPHPMWIFQPATGRFLSVNDAALHTYGYNRDEFLQLTLYAIHPQEDHRRLSQELCTATQAKQVWRHRRKSGEVFEVEIAGHDVSFQGTQARFVMAMDITERERLNRELVYRAQHDALTGLANRMLLEERAQQTIARSVRNGSKTAILTIDVDRFKQVNDTYGHLVGDECLKEIAVRLASRVREADTLARTGGEEFTVLVGGLASQQSALAAASALLGTLVTPLRLSSNEIAVSVSIGIAVYPDDGNDLDTIRKCSDKALYEAKRLGGGRAVLSSQEQAGETQSAISIEVALRNALQDGHLQLVYQPIFDATGRLARVEALLRGTSECLRNAGPGGFIPVAEESGLIVPLGRWVLEEACRQMAAWREQELPDFELAVNVSARQLVQSDFTEQVLQALERNNLPARLLHLELTETTLMRDFSTMVRSMKHLAEAGVLFSIDDFGTGYSSLARLSELPISTIKIDRSFVIKLMESETAVGIVRAIVHMSRHLQLEIVAEGVEEPEHIAMLLELGCDLFQGFHLSRPLSPQVFEEMVMAGRFASLPDFSGNRNESFLQA